MRYVKAKKSLGQNFIFDSNITDKIISYSGGIENNDILEIGPGPATLTKSILSQNPRKLVVIEKDERFADDLKKLQSIYPNLQIVIMDALKLSYTKECLSELGLERPKIIANLPYNIGTELLTRWIENIENFQSFTLMFQKEVALRICATEQDQHYGRLSIMVKLAADAYKCFDLPPGAFVPPPKVTSSVVHITPKATQVAQYIKDRVSILAKLAFSSRRKFARKNLSISIQDWCALRFEENIRAENISVAEFCAIAEYQINKES